ncbi:NCS2 family permease [Aerococcaceae bacterium INB8]|uniref:NCS2 family permease n=1 Tax=Ruoffia halotolerans TaxID=2748684 RepID=A0A839A342_9LACT|nr:NCS2 family permease [Ruoffia halotolerans]MBA5728569.1 NCS2 family permease [Ruoffia halotolerans]
MNALNRFFKLEEHNTTVSTEIVAGITTFLAMSYIIFVNPSLLALSGMPSQAVFLATLFASAISTLFIGLFANVPYALAPGMGLNAFFTYTVVFALGFTWQEALSMVFICGIINVLITVTKVRKMLILAIPEFLQHAISAGIGVFIGYLGIKNAGLLQFTSDASNIVSVNGQAGGTEINGVVESVVTSGGILPELVDLTQPTVLVVIIGLFITIALMILNVQGAILIGIIATTLLAMVFGLVDLSTVDFSENTLTDAFVELKDTFLVIFSSAGLPSLFSDLSKLPVVIMTIFAFSLADVFDTIGTFIGTGRRTGIFTDKDIQELEDSTGITSKMDRALFADSIGTVFGAMFGTSNTTTYVESAAGIGAGGRTGLTSVSTAICFILAAFFAPVISIVPTAATAPALIIVGILMVSSFADIEWSDFSVAVPAFFTSVFMGLAYSISNGIAAGFITYGLVKIVKGEAKEVHPILWISMGLFILNFIVMASF